MNIIQSIMNLFRSSKTKRQGKYSFESIREIKAEQDKILTEINKENGKANFKAYRNKMTRIEGGKL